MARISSRVFLGDQNVPQPSLVSNCNYLDCYRVLKIMDEMPRKSQRVKPISGGTSRSDGPIFLPTANETFLLLASMRCFTTADIKLSDGVVLPKNILMLILAQITGTPTIMRT